MAIPLHGYNTISQNSIYWSGSECLTKEPYIFTNRLAKVYVGMDTEDDRKIYDVECDVHTCNGGAIGGPRWINVPQWRNYKCLTSETNDEIVGVNVVQGTMQYLNEIECIKPTPYIEDWVYYLTNLSEDECTEYYSCQQNSVGICYKGSKYGFSTPFYVGDGATWAYTAP